MATFFLDLDGTIFLRGTNKFTPGTEPWLKDIRAKGHKIVIVTRRGNEEFDGHPIFSRESTFQALRELRIEYDEIIFDVKNPRVIIDDEECEAIQAERDKGSDKWKTSFSKT